MKNLILLLGLSVLLVGCRTPGPAEAGVGAAVPASAVVQPQLVFDQTEVRESATAGDGVVWGIGYLDGTAVLQWREDRWEKVENASEWPGSVLELIPSPSTPDVVYSVWGGPPQTGGNLTVLHVWKHQIGEPSERIASFGNPTVNEKRSNGQLPRCSVDEAGVVWFAFPDEKLVRLPAAGGEPQVIELDRSLFTRASGTAVRQIETLAYMPEAPGRGWLWTVQDEFRQSGRGELFRPARVLDGEVQACPEIQGLPDTGRVTWISRPKGGTMVWALEDAGLWEIDLASLSARPLPSPPDVWRILDWRRFPDGVEIAMGYGQRSLRGQMSGEVWLRRGSAWVNTGPCGDSRGNSDRPHTWAQWDGAVLGAGFYSGLLVVDGTYPSPAARNLDWRDRVNLSQPKTFHALPDGRMLIVGNGALVADVGALRQLWSTRTKPAVWEFGSNPVRAADGRIWSILVRGREAPQVRHWDGTTMQTWSLPDERSWWSDDALWVDAKSRAVVFSESLDKPAWERVETAPGGWRRWASGKELVEARATEPEPADTLFPYSEGFRSIPVLGKGGRALIRLGDLWSLADGVWTGYKHKELGTAPFRYGFEEDGTPWFYTNGKKRRLGDEGVWVDAGKVNDNRSRSTRTSDPIPDWLQARFEQGKMSSVHHDELGIWWIVQAGELWKGRDGEVSQVFADDEPSPFREGSGKHFYGVEADAAGNRLFDANQVILLPATPGHEVRVTWEPVRLQMDRSAEFHAGSAGDLVNVEWRLNDGEWQRAEDRTLRLVELPAGEHILEFRGYNRRLDAGPVAREVLRIDYDPVKRTAHLLADLLAPDYAVRSNAVYRLGLRDSEPQVSDALSNAVDETHRWWLRAALQAIRDRADNHLTSP